jgi:hypothetical protein
MSAAAVVSLSSKLTATERSRIAARFHNQSAAAEQAARTCVNYGDAARVADVADTLDRIIRLNPSATLADVERALVDLIDQLDDIADDLISIDCEELPF